MSDRMKQNIRIRRATPADAKDITRVNIESWRAVYKGIINAAFLKALDETIRLEKWRDNLTAQEGGKHIFVAENDQDIVGFAVLCPARDEAFKGYAELQSIYIDPSRYGHGAGTALLSACFQEAAALGYPSLYVRTLQENRRGRRFYERRGGQYVPGAAGDNCIIGDEAYTVAYYEWPDLNGADLS